MALGYHAKQKQQIKRRFVRGSKNLRRMDYSRGVTCSSHSKISSYAGVVGVKRSALFDLWNGIQLQAALLLAISCPRTFSLLLVFHFVSLH